MFCNRASHQTVSDIGDEDENAIRAAVEAQRIANSIPDHQLPRCRPAGESAVWRLLVAIYQGQLWLLRASLDSVKSIANALWQTDDDTTQQVRLGFVQIHHSLLNCQQDLRRTVCHYI